MVFGFLDGKNTNGIETFFDKDNVLVFITPMLLHG